ncbi:MAG: hypothetical protein Q8L37_03170 [Candidatus Gottesmanbacteria bacterium]|nr:hypothetical protein [Candidatus Gottesmanbacteria bacterium]
MSEQTINYGEAMFKDINPKAVLKGVGRAAKGWWDEFSPGTMGAKELESFENVVSRVKNEDLRALLEHKNMKTLVRGFGKLTGTTTLACDAFVATFPWYLRWKSRSARLDAFDVKANAEAGGRVLHQEHLRQIDSPEGRELIDAKKKEALAKLTKKQAWKDYWRGSPQDKKNLAAASKQARKELLQKADELIVDRTVTPNVFTWDGKQLVNEDVDKRVTGYVWGEGVKMAGLAGGEAALFAFRPVTRLAKLHIKAGEKVGSWVVDHIVNNIVRGPSAVPAGPEAKPAG